MAVSDSMVIMALGFVFNTLVIYKSNKFIGNMGYIGISLLIMSYGTDNMTTGIGLICLLGSIINLIYDWANK